MPLTEGRLTGLLYRALNPVYARDPLSGRGAALYGGRFNPKGMPALYTALDPATALREANQVGDLQPTTLVAYRADLGPVFDTRGADALALHGMTAQSLADSGWRAAMLDGQQVPTQDFARAMIAEGFVGLLVRSFAQGTSEANFSLVLWHWTGDGNLLEVIDDENRLGRTPRVGSGLTRSSPNAGVRNSTKASPPVLPPFPDLPVRDARHWIEFEGLQDVDGFSSTRSPSKRDRRSKLAKSMPLVWANSSAPTPARLAFPLDYWEGLFPNLFADGDLSEQWKKTR